MVRAFVLGLALLVPLEVSAEIANWQKEWKEAFRIAKEQRKLVFVDFYADWCGPCRVMDKKVFPTPEVQERLREYVLLRVDVDRASFVLRTRARALPAYIIYDAEERERFTFFGGMEAKDFIIRLDLAREGMPFMLRAADLFQQKQDLDAWIQVAKGYSRVRAPEKSREAWERARRMAESSGDRTRAQTAEINGAVTWVMEGKSAKAVALLQRIARAALSKENEALTWLTLARVYVSMNDIDQARAAFEKGKALVAPDHPIAREAVAALAQLH